MNLGLRFSADNWKSFEDFISAAFQPFSLWTFNDFFCERLGEERKNLLEWKFQGFSLTLREIDVENEDLIF